MKKKGPVKKSGQAQSVSKSTSKSKIRKKMAVNLVSAEKKKATPSALHKVLKMYFTLFLMIGFIAALTFAQRAYSMTAAEVEPGVIELNTTTINGFSIVDYAEKKVHGKNWVYFCVQSGKSPRSAKCFYGVKEEFKVVRLGLALNGLQYSLKNRIVNTKGHIPVQKSAYFYRALVVRPLS